MLFDPKKETRACPICDSSANVRAEGFGLVVYCSRCGDFWGDQTVISWWQSTRTAKTIALASHTIRKIQATGGLACVDSDFFNSLSSRTLPTPIEAMDNLILYIAAAVDGAPGKQLNFEYGHGDVLSTIGVSSSGDLHWVVKSLKDFGLVDGSFALNSVSLNLTVRGWERYEQLITAKTASRFAFFARKFANAELDKVFEKCLRETVKSTGYELRTVTQKAGPVDAIIEDEIRRCRFLIADLTDGNNGAYWEAGFAEGLGKPVIYICRDVDKETGKPIETHFDTDHRHTVRWNLDKLDETARQLKAVIRNTLLGDAVQSD